MTISVAIQQAWFTACDAYQHGLINSECTLHSLIYAELRSRLPDHLILCEPQINVERHGCFVPDIIVLKDRTVAAIVELKFVPHYYPVFELDLRKLAVLAAYEQSFPLLLDPESGRFTPDSFRVGSDCILVFAAIGQHDAAAVDLLGLGAAMGQFGERFVPLVHGVGG
ncbi:hypothetical protein [Thermomonas sp. LB-4]|uniref:hypothetical protein n=1 Tax=Thermomonas sp. LB-4 TaxID=3102790 RepID=UPI002ED8F23C